MAWEGGAAGAPTEDLGVPSCQGWDLSQPPLCFILQQLTPLSACLTSFISVLLCFLTQGLTSGLS